MSTTLVHNSLNFTVRDPFEKPLTLPGMTGFKLSKKEQELVEELDRQWQERQDRIKQFDTTDKGIEAEQQRIKKAFVAGKAEFVPTKAELKGTVAESRRALEADLVKWWRSTVVPAMVPLLEKVVSHIEGCVADAEREERELFARWGIQPYDPDGVDSGANFVHTVRRFTESAKSRLEHLQDRQRQQYSQPRPSSLLLGAVEGRKS